MNGKHITIWKEAVFCLFKNTYHGICLERRTATFMTADSATKSPMGHFYFLEKCNNYTR
jgi:hypothetical protein